MAVVTRFFPERVRRTLAEIRMTIDVRREFAADRRRYLASMLPDDRDYSLRLRGKNLEAQITKDYHRIEKGLSLQAPKRPFGLDVRRRLEALIPLADPNEPYAQHARIALHALDEWNSGGTVRDDVSPVRVPSDDAPMADPAAFFGTRHSVRDFADAPVGDEVIRRAVELALFSPSVCNRQSWKVYVRHGSDAAEALRFQNGSAAFRDQVPAVAIVTVDARAFAGAKERNQGWVDGGIFAMSLVWSLHSLGLDSCMLNMSVPTKKADALRRHLDADSSELIIMMVAIGYGREGHRRARSLRRDVGEVIDSR